MIRWPRIVDGAPQLLRRARGYVPLGIRLPFDVAAAARRRRPLKNVFALARGRFAYQSQHLGDLENLDRPRLLHRVPRAPHAHLRDRAASRRPRPASRLPLHVAGQNNGPPSAICPPSPSSTITPTSPRCMAEHAIAARSSASRSTAPATAPTAASGAAKSSSRDSTISSASPTSPTCPCPAAMQRSASHGAWRLAHLLACWLRSEVGACWNSPAHPKTRHAVSRMIERKTEFAAYFQPRPALRRCCRRHSQTPCRRLRSAGRHRARRRRHRCTRRASAYQTALIAGDLAKSKPAAINVAPRRGAS